MSGHCAPSLPAGRFEWERGVLKAGLAAGKGGTGVPAVAFALATFANADGTSVRPAQSTIATALGVDASVVSRALARLRREGFLELVIAHGPGRAAHYRLTLPLHEHGQHDREHAQGAVEQEQRVIAHEEPYQSRTRPVTTPGPQKDVLPDPWDLAAHASLPPRPRATDSVVIPSFYDEDPDEDGGTTAIEVVVDWSSVEAQVSERDQADEPYVRRYRNSA